MVLSRQLGLKHMYHLFKIMKVLYCTEQYRTYFYKDKGLSNFSGIQQWNKLLLTHAMSFTDMICFLMFQKTIWSLSYWDEVGKSGYFICSLTASIIQVQIHACKPKHWHQELLDLLSGSISQLIQGTLLFYAIKDATANLYLILPLSSLEHPKCSPLDLK